MATNPKPKGFHSVTPFLQIQDAAQLIDFARRAFGATELSRVEKRDGSIMHAKIMIGDSIVMLGDVSPGSKPSTATLYVYVDDADTIYKKAIDAGATSIEKPMDQFHGDHVGGVTDPGGNSWWIATHFEDVSPEEMKRRAEEWEREHATK